MRKRSYRLARKNGKSRRFLLAAILLGALSLVGAISYNGASMENQAYQKAQDEKLRLLEERFAQAQGLEEQEQITDQKAIQEAEAAKRAAEEAALRKAAEEEAARAAALQAIKAAETKITSTKTKQPAPAPAPANPEAGSSLTFLGTLSSTAYTHTGNNMANGEYPYEGAVACNLVPLGTKLFIEGYGYVVVKDRIGHSSQLDIFMDTYEECIQYGRRNVRVYIVQ